VVTLFLYINSNNQVPVKANISNTVSSVRFRRWSRAGYAVFRSLGKNVTIGNLTIAISDKALQKSDSTSLKLCCFADDTTKSDGIKEGLELKSILSELEIAILTEANSDKVAACAHNSVNYFIHYSG